MQVTLPNGLVLTDVPEDITQKELARRVVAGGIASYEELGISDPLAEERTIPGQIFETVKAVPRGFAGSFLTAGEGLAELADVATNFVGLEDLIDSGEENELVRLSREGRASLQEAMGADEAYRDTWMTKFGEGLGSFATFFTPAAALKVAGATGKIAGVAQTAGTGSLAVGMGAGEQAQRIQAAREQGIEVSEGDEDWAIFIGSGIGLSELLPVNRLLRRISADVDPATKIKIKERITGALATGGAEGLQEAVASILQDATERGFYNENLPATDMESLFDEFTIGGAVGTFADLALNGAAGRRREMAANAQTESQADEKEALDKAREDLSERVSAAMAAEAESQAGIPAPMPTTIDPAEIDRPSPTQIQSAAGTRLLTPGRYLSIRGPDGEIFQAEEKVSFKRDRRNPDRRIEERYVRKVNDDGSFSTITIARDGNPIPGIEVEEISPAPETIRSKRKDDPSLQYARHVRRLLGDDLLKAGSFTFTEERSADGVPVFRAVDSMGQRYGKAFETKEEAVTFAGNLNSQLIEANVSKSIEDSIDASGTDITSLDQKEAMFMYGYRILHPDQNLITSAELDQAGETTVATGFEEAAIPNSELGNYAPSKLTMSQRVNRKRLAQGKPATNMFTIEEAKSVLKDNFGNLRTGEIETETYAARKGADGKPVVVSSTGEVITGKVTGIKKKTKDGFEYQVRPFTSVQQANAYAQRRNKDRNLASIDESVFANKKVRQKEIERLLEAKNISTQVGSPAFRTMMEAFTGVKASGRKRLKDLSNAEMKVLYQKIRSLPAFTETTELVDFNLQPMKPIDYKLEPQAKTSPVSLVEQVPQTLALTDPAAQPVEGLDQIQSKLDEAMKSVGLSDIKANINHSLRNVLRDANGNLVFGIRPRREEDQDVTEFGWQGSGIVVETSPDAGVQAMYSNAANEIFLGMDRLDSSKPIDQQVDEALELLAHEQVHAMRTMNLFTDKEWETLSKAAANRKSKTEPDKTFLEIAAREYANQPDEVIIEEAVAELVRVSRKDPKVVSGKPKSLIKKIYNFLADLIGFRDSTGFESFQDLIADIETGVVGARERGGRLPVGARRTAEEIAEETRTPDFLPEMVEEEVEEAVDEVVPLADRYSLELFPGGADPESINRYLDEASDDPNRLEKVRTSLTNWIVRSSGAKSIEEYNSLVRAEEAEYEALLRDPVALKALIKVPNTFFTGPRERARKPALSEKDQALEAVAQALTQKMGLKQLRDAKEVKQIKDVVVNDMSDKELFEAIDEVFGSPVVSLEDRYARRRSSTPVESAVNLSKTKYADFNSAVEEEFFGEFWPRLMSEVKGTVTKDKVRLAAKRSVQDINEFISKNPKYKDYYDSDQAAVLASLEGAFDNITNDDLLFYQLANGLSSPATSLPANVGDALNFLSLYKQDGNLDSIEMGIREKRDKNGNIVRNLVIQESPFKVSGTTGSGKARSMKIIDRLIKENSDSPNPVSEVVEFLQEGVTAKELQAFNRKMGYKSAVPDMKAIRSLVKQATGQDEKIPRMFIFGKKVGAYTLNLTGKTNYTTIDVWESRLIRSYFEGMFEENTGIPKTVDEDLLFQDFSREFKKEYEKFAGSSVDSSALQAMRWFYIINAAKEAGYRGASTNETISELTEKYIQKRRSGESRDGRRRKSDAKIAEEIQQETTLLPDRYSRSTRIIDYIKENPDGFTIDPVTLETPSGVAVAPVKALEVKFAPENVTEDLIDQTVDNYKLLADELDRDVYIGGWFNNEDGLFYLDASITAESKEEALYIADAGNQEAVFDLNTFEETRTDEGIRDLKETGAYDSQAADAARRDKEKLDRLFAKTGDRGQAQEVRQRADGTTVGGDTEIQKITRDSGVIKKVVEENEKAAVDTPASFVPEFNYRADPEAQYVARNPEEGLPPNPNLLDRYSRKNSPELSQDVKNVVNRIAPEAPPNKTPGETYLETTEMGDFEYWTTKVRQAAVNKWARLEQIARLPQFKENLADTSAMAAAIFSDRSMGIVGSALKSGVAVYRNGVVKVEDFYHTNKRGERKKYRGLVDVMAPLFQNKYGVSLEELAQAYAVARRAEGMRQRGLPTPAKAGDLALIEAEIAKYVNENGDSIIEEWYDTWQAYNNKTVEFMKATGLVDDALAQKWLEMSDYIPFYRQGEAPEGEIANLGQDVPSMFKSGMTTAFSFKKLKGSEKGVNVPMLDAITRNLSMAIDAGMKNVAQQRIVRDMATIGLAKKATPAQIKNKKQNFVVSFKVQGKDLHYKVDDPLLYESLQPLESGGLATSLVAKPSKFLRELITREPGFILANMMRDTLSAYTTSGADFVPVIDTVKNFGRGIEELERFGVVGGYDFGNDPEDIVEAFAEYSKERGIDVEGGKTGLGMFKKLWNAAGRATTASDAATRRAVYNDVLARTGNEAEAAFQALEVINFSRRGRSPFVRFMTAGIPFLNARVQGLDVLYRGFMGYNPANREKTRSQAVMTAIARGGLITASTLAYWLLVSDDDQYKDTPDEQKDLNWLIPTPMGVPVRIPVPFEVGFIFKTIPERILDTYPVAEVFGKPGATSGRELTDSVFRGIGSTFELNPLGIQAIAPLVEATMNYNFFTGREIVPLYASKKPMQGLVSRESNMEVSKWIGEAMNVSPMKVDHVLYGYTGTLGSYLLDSIDHLVAKNPVFTGDKATSAPSKAITELPVLKRFFVNEFSSDNRSDFYRLHNAVTGLDQAIKSLDEQNRFEEAEALIRTQGHLLDLKHDVNYISNRLSKLRKERTEVERSDASPELKRELLLQINEEMDALTQDVPLLKKYAGLPAFPRFQLWGT